MKKKKVFVIETDAHVETVIDHVRGEVRHFIPLSAEESEDLQVMLSAETLKDINVSSLPSEVLEKVFHSVNCELQMRDAKWCEENL